MSARIVFAAIAVLASALILLPVMAAGRGPASGIPAPRADGVTDMLTSPARLYLSSLFKPGGPHQPTTEPATAEPYPTATPASYGSGLPIVVQKSPVDPADWVVDPLTIQDVQIAGDRLTLSVRHGGGCRTHDNYLVAAKTFMESNPVQSDVLLTHDAHGDLCRALIHRDLAFDLGPLKRAFQEAYGQVEGTIVLRIRGWDRPVSYDF